MPPGAAPLLATIAGLSWHVDPLSVRVGADQNAPTASSSAGIDIAAQMGEYEARQLWIHSATYDLFNVSVQFKPLLGDGRQSAEIAPDCWSYFQVGYVTADRPMYNCSFARGSAGRHASPPGTPSSKSGGHGCPTGWHADVLFDMPPYPKGIPVILRNTTQPIVLQLLAPRAVDGGKPGNYSGSFGVSGSTNNTAFYFEVPVCVEIWPFELPRVGEPGAFTTILSFEDDPLRSHYYPELTQSQLWQQWLPFLSRHRITGDNIYVNPHTNDRTLDIYQAMASHGATWMNLMEAWSWLGHSPGRVSNVSSDTYALVRHLQQWLGATGLAGRSDLLNKSYVYGFDEWPRLQNNCKTMLRSTLR